ncbi:MAG: DNA adenine methylase [Chloroflexi bacterium]|nr:DNA adenine methylase [Chloroflexota bacterium]
MSQEFLLPPHGNIRAERIAPVIKWAGGKESELKHILPNLPERFERYFEPFVGGGAVYFSVNADEMLINDKSSELITLYRLIKSGDKEFFDKLTEINKYWKLLEHIVEDNSLEFSKIYSKSSPENVKLLTIKDRVTEFVLEHHEEFSGILKTSFNLDIDNFINEVIRNMTNKIDRMRVIEREKGNLSRKDVLSNVESALKSAFYMHFRHLYNKKQVYGIGRSFSTAIFYFVREYCYASMFRYNSRGEFNVPYGGIQYNRKDFLKKIKAMQSKDCRGHLQRTKLFNADFEEFLKYNRPTRNDFIFFDPPYDTDFSTYAKNEFDKNDQIRLAKYLYKTKAKFMLIIKSTDFILDLYSDRDLNIRSFDKKYIVSFQDRNDKNAEHLLITNY